ncbi:hypothetical protein SAY87_014804 [Trapa incisa]|uniref:Myb-like domain-containing protein n=1 Tax=Trapa incisa TaxID=236973 RepID=A0AAN7GW60_9MYRT|nr:hypothetical protein SAY87_014804 [Trapa incisa]
MEGLYGHSYRYVNPQPQQAPQQQVRIAAGNSPSDRFPQWSLQETKDFLTIRAELDLSFMEARRNKPLWEVISNKMKDLGYNRSPDQCKFKWKNLVTRYKGCETTEPTEVMRQQFPFYNDIEAIFSTRMQMTLWTEAEETRASGSKKKKMASRLSSNEEDGSQDSEGAYLQNPGGSSRKNKKKMTKKARTSNGRGGDHLVKLLEEFMKQQEEMEAQWRESLEAREKERRMREMEWLQRMEMIEKERIEMDSRRRQWEEQMRVREDARAERRDALITALLNKLASGGGSM